MRKALEFTLNVSNCLGCHFCPQDKLAAVYEGQKRFSIYDFEGIIKQVPAGTEIHFSGFSECFLHPQCDDFVVIAKALGFEVHIYTTLVGLREDQARVLADYKPNFFRIHVPDSQHLKIPDEKWIRHHELFLCIGAPSFSYMTMGVMTDRVNEYMTGRTVEFPQMLSRGGNLGWAAGDRPIKGPLTCQSERWHMNVVLPNGDVVLCSMDYGLKMPVGNLFKDTYEQIYQRGETYREDFNPPENSPCRSCEWSRPI